MVAGSVILLHPFFFFDQRADQNNHHLPLPSCNVRSALKSPKPCSDFGRGASDLSKLCSEQRPYEALKLFVSLEARGFRPDPFVSAQLLQASVLTGSYETGRLVHHHLLNASTPILDTYTGNNLISMYIKFSKLEDAYKVFDEMPQRNVISWSSLITAETQRGNFLDALQLFEEMMEDGLSPNEFTMGSLLKASSGLMDIWIGKQLHSRSIRSGFSSEMGVQTALVTMYSKCKSIKDAEQIFDKLPPSSKEDVPLWNSIMAAYVHNGLGNESLRLFSEMVSLIRILRPTEATYATILNACSSTGAIQYGKIIHGKIIKDGLHKVTRLGNSLVTFYAKCGKLEDASKIFATMASKNIVSWNAMVAGHEQNGHEKEAIELFRKLVQLEWSVKPNRITFLSVLSATSSLSALKQGSEVHGRTIKLEINDVSIGNSLITMYGKCGDADKASKVFKSLPHKDAVSWNSMLAAYAHSKQSQMCFSLFKEMQLLGIKADSHTLTVLISCASTKSLRHGKEFHGYVLRGLFGDGGVSMYNALIAMYAKCGRLVDAEKVFEMMIERDSYSWNAMMDGYSINGHGNDAILLFLEMQRQGLQSDHLAFSILLTTCGRLVSLKLGRQFHSLIIKTHPRHRHQSSFLLSIDNAVVSMYAKCGSIDDARCMFARMAKTDVFSWTAMITGYAHHGMGHESLQLFERMKACGIKPNSVTFLGLLTACAHAGLVDQGCYYFSSMSKAYGLKPGIEHYACMVDIFGRSRQFERALRLIEASVELIEDDHDSACLWRVLLGACHAHKQLQLGVCAALKVLELEPNDETAHVLLSNLYAASGMWVDAINVRKMMKERGLKKKEVGCSWIEIGQMKHNFVAGDVCHPHRKEIYEKLGKLNKECEGMGYAPMVELVLHDVEQSQKEAIIASHSEKLAVSFALLQRGPYNGIIRVIKNLRVCEDCHNWMNFVSLIEGREIILRDSHRFHCFKDGRCSCGDYW